MNNFLEVYNDEVKNVQKTGNKQSGEFLNSPGDSQSN